MGEKFNEILQLIKKGLLEIIYPGDSSCIICGKTDEDILCNECKNSITSCEDELCIGYYRGVLKELILNFKYKNDFSSGDVLIKLVEERLKYIDEDYYLTYIPIGKKSLKERGFNQCEYVAKELAFRNKLQVMETIIKIKETKVQKSLKKEERQKNLIGAFSLKDKTLVKGKKFILIDDVVTTGATLKEGIKILKEGGAKEIKVLTLAKSHI